MSFCVLLGYFFFEGVGGSKGKSWLFSITMTGLEVLHVVNLSAAKHEVTEGVEMSRVLMGRSLVSSRVWKEGGLWDSKASPAYTANVSGFNMHGGTCCVSCVLVPLD